MELISFLNYKKKSNIIKAKNGDNEAFLELINENKLNIYRVARGILSNEHDIEDAIQNTIIKAYEKINTLKKNEFFRTWLVRILINECNEIIRKNKRIVSINESNHEEKYNDYYENIDLTNAINSLSEELRVTTVLFYFEDMSIKDIALILNIPNGTVRSRLSRARKILREIIGDDAE
ncbi:MAG: sigma-70 family RNA polymerase sigma factor [Clostridium celatum]|uniref:RNA polymerase sigma factor n=1 Tax=uncultured Clostridium sp. TaxID=59620 RepID=UPI0025E8A7A2|nr:sigma-70 family RNA polymerase sigma factor [uncultured Clostridium sp.]MDU4884723.1 sigma-70 family RNA polymerase sigma factor [Clostridium celatum]MDU5263144.1 sigma-70 family RNA polymerase sigma factor [Clostridium celatum]MDU7077947.1 sigma-70 family RNA polymerase sigma factor [Clostridium celatum]